MPIYQQVPTNKYNGRTLITWTASRSQQPLDDPNSRPVKPVTLADQKRMNLEISNLYIRYLYLSIIYNVSCTNYIHIVWMYLYLRYTSKTAIRFGKVLKTSYYKHHGKLKPKSWKDAWFYASCFGHPSGICPDGCGWDGRTTYFGSAQALKLVGCRVSQTRWTNKKLEGATRRSGFYGLPLVVKYRLCSLCICFLETYFCICQSRHKRSLVRLLREDPSQEVQTRVFSARPWFRIQYVGRGVEVISQYKGEDPNRMIQNSCLPWEKFIIVGLYVWNPNLYFSSQNLIVCGLLCWGHP